MKIIYHDPEGDVTYTRIARVDFSPEVDIKLNSLPVDMFTADIITPDTMERGWLISLKNDADTLFAKFKITKVQRINKDTLRVEAVSPLWLMDWWTVGAERIQTTAGAAVNDLFNGLPKSGYLSIIPYTLPTELANININGFAPEQTARERLLWLCLAMGAWVQQSFCNGLVFHALPNFSNHDLTQGTLIPYKRTYWKPSTQLGDPVYVVWVELVGNISTDETTGTQSGTDESGTTYYWNLITHGYTNPDENAPGGSEVKISGVSLLNNEYQQPTFSLIGALYQNRMEVSAEVINNGDIQPGDVVRVYTDEDLIYCGVVQQCTFTFGQQAKARLTVNAYPDELPIQIVRVSFTSGDVPLGQATEVYPEGDTWEVDAPTIDGYTPNTPSITGSTGGNYSIDYTKIPLKYIVAYNGSFTQYLEGKNISYANLLVLGYQTERAAAIQVKWTNGGQWLGGKIPFEALTLPVTKAVYDPTTPSQEYPGASIQTIPVQYIDESGTTFEDTFNVLVWENKPVTLQIVTPPTTLEYADGVAIDYTGMVVRALLPTGQPWEDDEHPGGIIPFSELILPEYADFSKVSVSKGIMTLDGNSVEVATVWHYTQYWNGQLNRSVVDTCLAGALFIRNAYNRLYAITDREGASLHYANGNDGLYIYTPDERGQQGFCSIGDYFCTSAVTGKTIYGTYYLPGADWAGGNDNPWRLEQEPELARTPGLSNVQIADIALYGTGSISGRQEITVGWKRPQDEQELCSTLDIVVTNVGGAT